MSIRMFAPGPSGSAYLYHRTPNGGEHFFVGRVRRTSTATLLYCHLCDAVTTVPRNDANEEHRAIQAFIDAGQVVPVAHSGDLDPLIAGKEDADAGVTTPTASRKSITLPVPQDTAGRRAAVSALRSAHHDRRPPGARFQKWTSDTTFEVHEDDGTGKTAAVETYDVDANSVLTRR